MKVLPKKVRKRNYSIIINSTDISKIVLVNYYKGSVVSSNIYQTRT